VQVIGAFLTPAHDKYIFHKVPSAPITNVHRCELIKLAIKEAQCDDWLSVDPWERYNQRVAMIDDVVDTMAKFVRNALIDDMSSSSQRQQQQQQIQFYYLCGADLYQRAMGFPLMSKFYHIIVMNRPGYGTYNDSHSDSSSNNSLQFLNRITIQIDNEQSDCSSTLIRDELAKGEAEGKPELYTYPSIVQYIKQHKLLDKSSIASGNEDDE